MLFDLRSRRRRNAVKVVYGGLALLIGLGLVGFGIGTGFNFGGIFTAAANGGGAGGTGNVAARADAEEGEEAGRRPPGLGRRLAERGQGRLCRRRAADELRHQLGASRRPASWC